MSNLSLYWCGWNVPDELPVADFMEKWPEGMKGWGTGYGDGYATYVGAVWARTPNAAMAVVRSAYGKHAPAIVERWEPETRPDDWKPGDRFQGDIPKKPSEAAP